MKTAMCIAAACLIVLGAVLLRESQVENDVVTASTALRQRHQATRTEAEQAMLRIAALQRALGLHIRQLLELQRHVAAVQELRTRLAGEMGGLLNRLGTEDNGRELDEKWLPFWLDGSRRERVVENLVAVLGEIRTRDELRQWLETALERLGPPLKPGDTPL